MHRRVFMKGSGGVDATVIVFARQGTVLMSIDPPFTWEAIMDPDQVDGLIRILQLAQEDARKMVVSRGGQAGIYRRAEPAELAASKSSS